MVPEGIDSERVNVRFDKFWAPVTPTEAREAPEVPEDPLEPEVPEDPVLPLVPLDPVCPELPEDPDVPLVPEDPGIPEVPPLAKNLKTSCGAGAGVSLDKVRVDPETV